MEEDRIGYNHANGCDGPFDDLIRNAINVCEHIYAVREDGSKNIVDVVDKITR